VHDLDGEVGLMGHRGHRRVAGMLPCDVVPRDEEHLVQVSRGRGALGDAALDVGDERRVDHALLAGAPQRREERIGVQGGEVRRRVGNQRAQRPPGSLVLHLGELPAA
jgi:hypothetical protein